VAKTSPYGIALNYAMNELPRVRLYLSHGECEIDNNAIENAIRPFAMGRKNWLFSDTESGAESSAAIYTVLQTAKANGLNVSEYMDYILEALPACQSIDDYVKLLPWNTFKAD
jgi:transposase